MAKLGTQLSDKELDEMIKMADTNADGQVSYEGWSDSFFFEFPICPLPTYDAIEVVLGVGYLSSCGTKK